MDTSKIAAQLYTVRNFARTENEVYETLKKIKEIGFNAVQISGIAKVEPKKLKNFLDEFALEVCATHISFDVLKNNINDVINEHHILECKHIAVPSMPNEYKNKEDYLKFAEELNKLGKILSENSITLSYHNHSFELEKFDGITGLEIIYDNTDPQFVKAEIDTFWIQHGGASVSMWLKKLIDRMDIIHLKDMAIKNGKQVMSEIGNGNLNWEEILSICKQANIEWYIIEQDDDFVDPFESLKISLNYLKALNI
ncbi:sugar phosphate isomerase/epimerase family protein [Caldicellulosiruptoraceae bacterium PP1]